MNRVVVLVPVHQRTTNLATVYRSHCEADTDAAFYFVAADGDDAVMDAMLKLQAPYHIVSKDRTKWSQKINDGIARTFEPWILCGADDIVFQRKWVEAIAGHLDSGFEGVYGTNDLGNGQVLKGLMSTHPLIHRNYTKNVAPENISGVLFEGYHHNYPDTELALHAQSQGMYKHLRHCIVEHRHPAFGKAADDPTYLFGRSRFFEDQSLFSIRCRKFGWHFGASHSFNENSK